VRLSIHILAYRGKTSCCESQHWRKIYSRKRERTTTLKTIKVFNRRKPRASEPALEVLAARREARYLMAQQRSVVKVGFGAK
jgi:hypothetical protein